MTNEQIIKRAAEKGKDPKTRWVILLLGAIAILSMTAFIVTGMYALGEASKNAQAGKHLAQDVRENCDADPSFSAANPDLCDDAVAVEKETVEVDQPEKDDPDPNDPEIQDQEFQNSEIQDLELQEREIQQDEVDQAERQEREIQDREDQEPEIDDAPIPGKDGQDGSDGSDGKDAPPVTNEQLSQTWVQFCSARGDCIGPRGPEGPPGPEGPVGAPGRDATCEGAFVCEDELNTALADYFTGAQVVDLLRALGCDTAAEGPGVPLQFTCTITGKP